MRFLLCFIGVSIISLFSASPSLGFCILLKCCIILIAFHFSHFRYANVKTHKRHVRTRLYFTYVCVIESETALMEQESHIHSLMNVLRYCNMDESLQGEESLISQNALFSFFATLEWALLGFYVFLVSFMM